MKYKYDFRKTTFVTPWKKTYEYGCITIRNQQGRPKLKLS